MAIRVPNILALLFGLPLQTISYVKTLSHFQKLSSEEVYGHETEHHHHHEENEHHEHTAPFSDDFATHQHSSGEAPHCHAKDFFGVFSNVFAFPSHSQETFPIEQSYSYLPVFNVISLQSQISGRSLLRPPIYAS